MHETVLHESGRRWVKIWRIGVTVVSIVASQSAVCGLSLAPVILYWDWLWSAVREWSVLARALAISVSIVPAYALFALLLIPVSALETRVTGARTRPDESMRIAEMEWPLMTWVRYMAATHVVRVLAGPLIKGTPVWTAYLWLNGAQVGRRVYINTLSVSDHNLLRFDDDVVVGADVHLSGHTVEGGVVKSGRVHLATGVTIGLGSVIGIDVVVGARTQVGAISLVPKHSQLEPGAVYAGVPVKRIDHMASEEALSHRA
jgi:acetyltransferase-like isoleucine patch superfamily enzyme